jgi:hypothetical protein
VKAVIRLAAALVVLSCLACGTNARADVVYDNTVAGLSLYYHPDYPGVEFGDQVTLGGTARVVTTFEVILYSEVPSTADLQGRFYANDGAGGVPETLLWSDVLSNLTVDQITAATFDLSSLVPAVVVPDTFTWTVSAGNMDVGVIMYDPPLVGFSADAFWEYGASWQEYWFGGDPVANFGARIEATPEPATLCLMGAGAVGLVARRFRRR